MAKLLIHVTHGPEHPTPAALSFLVAKTAIDEGHQVTLFLAGDAVQLVRDPVLEISSALEPEASATATTRSSREAGYRSTRREAQIRTHRNYQRSHKP